MPRNVFKVFYCCVYSRERPKDKSNGTKNDDRNIFDNKKREFLFFLFPESQYMNEWWKY